MAVTRTTSDHVCLLFPLCPCRWAPSAPGRAAQWWALSTGDSQRFWRLCLSTWTTQTRHRQKMSVYARNIVNIDVSLSL